MQRDHFCLQIHIAFFAITNLSGSRNRTLPMPVMVLIFPVFIRIQIRNIGG